MIITPIESVFAANGAYKWPPRLSGLAVYHKENETILSFEIDENDPCDGG